MSTPPPALDRRQVYAALITLAAAISLGRVLIVERPYADNDLSRWLTAEALATEGTYAIGERLEYANGEFVDRGILFKDGKLRAIDVVLNPQPAETFAPGAASVPVRRKLFYSSKPTLLPTLLGNLVSLGQAATGIAYRDQPWLFVRLGLFVFNWLPFVLMLLVLASLIDRIGTTDWGKMMAVAGACFGTFLTSFQTSINNHTLAAAAVTFSCWFWLHPRGVTPFRLAIAGFWAGFAAANELPALSFVGLVAVLLVLQRKWLGAGLFFLAAGVPMIGQVGLNWLALGSWLPAYAQFGSEWYEFPGAYWNQPVGIDAASDPKPVYLFHLVSGHHGFFSLTPLLLYGWAGVWRAWRRPVDWAEPGVALGWLAPLLLAVLLGFYVWKTNNYGGWTVGPRWLLWLVPLWLPLVPVGLDWAARNPWRRGTAGLLLAISAFSAHQIGLNPWYHPWLYRLASALGWVAH